MNEKLVKRIKALITSSLSTDKSKRSYECVNAERSYRGTVEPSGIVEDNPEDFQLNNKQATLLIKLSQQIGEAELKEFNELLLTYTKNNYKKQIVEAVSLYFIHTGQTGTLLNELLSSIGHDDNNSAQLNSMFTIIESLRYRPDIFSESESEAILDWCELYFNDSSENGQSRREYSSLYSKTSRVVREINTHANEIFTRHFEKQIDTAFNPELNVDEAKVVEVINVLGLPLDLHESLKHIDQLVKDANEPMKYRDAMAAMRVFTERLYEQVAKGIDKNTKVTGKDSESAAKYFMKSKLISHDVADILTAHRHFLSNDGTHRIKSRREDARIGKNMTIELSLYLLTRLREYKELAD